MYIQKRGVTLKGLRYFRFSPRAFCPSIENVCKVVIFVIFGPKCIFNASKHFN